MNYLAHLALSGSDEQIMAGNFTGDAVKGQQVNTFPPLIKRGIMLHRHIDEFTDHHPLVLQTKKIFAPEFDKYSGALTDIYFDHLLARNFSEIYHADLQQFAYSCYHILGKYYHLFPARAKEFYQYMLQNNILYRYADLKGIEKVLHGMTHRIANRAPLFKSIPIFLDNASEIEELFFDFYPELRHSCELFLSESIAE